MAYDASNETRKELLMIEKNTRGDKILVTLIEKKVSSKQVEKSVDIRNMYTDSEDIIRPTQKGVRISEENLYDIVKAITDVLSESQKEQLIYEIGLEV